MGFDQTQRREAEITIKKLLEMAVSKEATDVHLVCEKPPIFRIHGELQPSGIAPVSSRELKDLIYCMMSEDLINQFEQIKEADFSYFCMDDYQFRVNAHVERNNVAANIRITPTRIASQEELGLPSVIEQIALKRKGLIILSGPAGSGKTTTLTYMVDYINRHRKCKIVTIEDPVEYVHKSNKSLIVQREVGSDTESFASALKYALRQDPDVVVVGEMRDLESISMALTTAETGHLVITTLHAPDTVETVNRIIDVYPAGNQEQIRVQLAENLLAVIGQVLIPREEMNERILATEVLLTTRAIRNLIRRGGLVEVRAQMDAEAGKGMHSMERCLSELIKKGLISKEKALEYAKYPDMLRDDI